MKYSDFANEFASVSGRTKTESKELCDTFLALIKDIMKRGDSLELHGFGKLEPYTTQSRMIHTLQNENIMSKPHKRVKFKQSAAFFKELNKDDEN